ncbi:hypothetical protein [Neoaquamicrobium sediminum]|uniref:Uncharacterized protein n=1 Tax=Neoaquamicrobium sediminum TaxID=1849104 RepID=A0ABV3X1Q6_9HYPH|nr:hypothetical protein [Mesorhizobium sediminum]NRC56415.1 hypothetical protein [Mesorhizobium sediminum]
MLVDVGPAKRVGNRKKIYDRALREEDVAKRDGITVITICADGIHGSGALYRYELQLSPSDLAVLMATVDS